MEHDNFHGPQARWHVGRAKKQAATAAVAYRSADGHAGAAVALRTKYHCTHWRRPAPDSAHDVPQQRSSRPWPSRRPVASGQGCAASGLEAAAPRALRLSEAARCAASRRRAGVAFAWLVWAGEKQPHCPRPNSWSPLPRRHPCTRAALGRPPLLSHTTHARPGPPAGGLGCHRPARAAWRAFPPAGRHAPHMQPFRRSRAGRRAQGRACKTCPVSARRGPAGLEPADLVCPWMRPTRFMRGVAAPARAPRRPLIGMWPAPSAGGGCIERNAACCIGG
jgi:hypothetical protein